MNKAIDLFAGAGGLSLGLKMAGWDVSLALEYDPGCLKTHSLNMQGTVHICDDIQNINFRKYKNIDLIAGGPPCQPFSVSGKQLGKMDARDMVPEFVRAIREARPRAFLMENVSGLTSPRFLPYLQQRLSEFAALGYDVYWKVLNAADYGVPQKRLRLFIVGLPCGIPFEFPEPTHGPVGKHKHVTVRDALRDTPSDEANKAKVVYAKNPIIRKSPYAGMLLNGKGRPLNLNMPSLTIPATAGGNRTHILDPKGVLRAYHQHLIRGGKPRKGEVGECRRLTVRESARLQTFPDWFEFHGGRSQQYSQIGNAVPPVLAKAVGSALLKSVRKASNAKAKAKT